ncbi:post-GPI attachment to proteins factor 6 isoform X2 [Girardinichthys multiradiatus]|uniref:post-GPI attachment to proteins factor 6 isoform X2 n=1 Tax=Girardinichthys multiradiatus TaxID=208333 RepID=UPI001FABF9F9|nr:post-GPI attachment to proteins factor 6 isoform X2 [Girardinichthys multiradiatus]XP_047224170.1 post-GPI attachment to proteins factor 6 isoform X2 [Girardinichthys multiradiatus]XP_047224172.1 post-GPI attachment to proteins factor 6 isoform X2 [Girardinichthys multiradiatus]
MYVWQRRWTWEDVTVGVSERKNMDVCFLRWLLFVALTTWTLGDDGQVTFVSELSSRPAQKLSKYGWYANVRLQRFHIPEETAIAYWLFSVKKGHSFNCGQHNVSIHIRWSAPPVINPTETLFPNSTLWHPSLSLTLPVTSQSSTTFNLSDPAPGDWFVAAHLPEDDGRIEQKGFPSCSYYFQPQLSVRRAVDTPVLQQGTFLTQTAAPDRPARLKLFVPEFASSLSVSVAKCSSGEAAEGRNCSLLLRLGSASLQHSQATVNCSGSSCSASLSNPPWDTWLRVVVETSQVNQTVTFRIVSNYTVACKPKSVGLNADDDITRLLGKSSISNSTSTGNSSGAPASVTSNGSEALIPQLSACVWSIPMLYEELDVLSLRFTPANGSNISITDTQPTLLTFPLPTQATGGTLNLQLTLNSTNATLGNNRIVACFSPWAPVLVLNHSEPCRTALFGGYGVGINVSVPKVVVRLPFPQSTTWYLTLQLVCNSSNCGNSTVVSVVPEVSISACVEDCGPYGECRLLRSYTYLYAACVCTAGWKGWGCTDGSTAQSYSRQLTATMLLTLSNLFFLPAIVVAIRRSYITEASVYLFTMFFSTFYHACDQPGAAVLCIMDYDALQYCDFLGSICAIWVTILCMARIGDTAKYTLFLLGALLIAMSMQLDRKGLWNLLAPILCAILLMVISWVYRGVRRRHCYPPSWQRWVFYLIPGALCSLVGVCLYIFAETESNYYYTHSLWHILVASCVVFLLPPKEKDRKGLGWSQGFNWSWRWSWRPRVWVMLEELKTPDEI